MSVGTRLFVAGKKNVFSNYAFLCLHSVPSYESQGVSAPPVSFKQFHPEPFPWRMQVNFLFSVKKMNISVFLVVCELIFFLIVDRIS